MKTIVTLCLLLAVNAFGAGLRIGQFPNTATPADGDKFVLENAAATTNNNVTWAQLKVIVGTASTNYANIVSNRVQYLATAASTNYTDSISNKLFELTTEAATNYVNTVSNNVFQLSTQAATNYVTQLTTDYIQGASNLTVNMDVMATEIYLTNDITLTNFSGLVLGQSKSKVIFLIPQGAARAITYPAAGANWGIYWNTNCPPTANIPYASVTNGSTYVLTIQSRGTNLYPVMTEWK